jgi:hypothetical protein
VQKKELKSLLYNLIFWNTQFTFFTAYNIYGFHDSFRAHIGLAIVGFAWHVLAIPDTGGVFLLDAALERLVPNSELL